MNSLETTAAIGRIVNKAANPRKLDTFLALDSLSRSTKNSRGYDCLLSYLTEVAVNGQRSNYHEFVEELREVLNLKNYAEKFAAARAAHPSVVSLIAIDAMVFGLQKEQFEALISLVDPGALDPSSELIASIHQLMDTFPETIENEPNFSSGSLMETLVAVLG